MKYSPAILPLLALLGTGCHSQSPMAPAVTQAPAPATAPPSTVPVPAATVSSPAAALPKGGLRLEAEQAALTGSTMQTKRAGFSGTGYVGSFQGDSDKAVWTVPNVHPGLYELRLRYSAPFGQKGYDLSVNGAKKSGTFPATGDVWNTISAGKAELTAGQNTIELDRGWGYFDIDRLDLVPVAAATSALAKPSATPVDPQATPAARALLASLVKAYGTQTLTGQYSAKDNDTLHAQTGKAPAIFGTDLIDFSPTRVEHGGMPKGVVEEAIARARAGQIVTVSWHWNAPTGLLDKMSTDAQGKPLDLKWYKGFNANATTFDVQKALADPNSPDYKLLLRDIDAIAAPLQQLQAAGVPVLWRPCTRQKAAGSGGARKGPGAFKQLWQLVYTRLTTTDHLHNLIWVYSATQALNPDWYPGDKFVDVAGTDLYPSDTSDPLDTSWETLQQQYGGRKLVALTEFGGVPDVDKMRRYGVRWSYFVTWSGFLNKTPKDVTARIYQSANVLDAPH